jgi:hypothetical protein
MPAKEWSDEFAGKYPKPVDFQQAEFEANSQEMTRIALEAGYQFVGFRLGRAVFSTK